MVEQLVKYLGDRIRALEAENRLLRCELKNTLKDWAKQSDDIDFTDEECDDRIDSNIAYRQKQIWNNMESLTCKNILESLRSLNHE